MNAQPAYPLAPPGDFAWPDDVLQILYGSPTPAGEPYPESMAQQRDTRAGTTDGLIQRVETAPCPLFGNCSAQLPEGEHRGLVEHFEQYHAAWWQEVVNRRGGGTCPVIHCRHWLRDGRWEDDSKRFAWHVATHVHNYGRTTIPCLQPGCTMDFMSALSRESHLETAHGLASELLADDQGWVYRITRISS